MILNVLVYYMYNTPNIFFVKNLHETNTILFFTIYSTYRK